MEKYPEITDYVCDYGIFAADDDSNGPLFFVRSLYNKTDITPEDIGNVFLNYIQEYAGFFWWGGVGVSTEHTAYENLKYPTQKPEGLLSRIIKGHSNPGDLVFDCFMGVGGTLLGAALADRTAAGIELNQKYIDAYKAVADELGY